MRKVQANELIRLQTAQAETLNDVCVIMTAAEIRDSLNAPVEAWTDGSPTKCGLNMTGGRKQTPEGLVIITWDAQLRLAKGTKISQTNRIQMLERYGQPMAAIIYQIVVIEDGPSGILLRMQNVDPSV